MTPALSKAKWPLAVATAGVAALFFLNPAVHGFFPQCLFHRLTGWNCPGCGATRAAHALLHARFAEACHDNALLLAAGLWLAVEVIIFRRRRLPLTRRGVWLFVILAAVFTVVRNLPSGEWLSP